MTDLVLGARHDPLWGLQRRGDRAREVDRPRVETTGLARARNRGLLGGLRRRTTEPKPGPLVAGPAFQGLSGGDLRAVPASVSMGVIYFGIRVTDLERSLRFYQEGLGLVRLRGGRMPHGGRRVLLADGGTGQRIELNWYPPDSPYATTYVPGEGLDHIGFSTGRAAEVARRLEAVGGRVMLRPTDPAGVRQNFYVADPDGNWIELMAWGTSRTTSRRTLRSRPPNRNSTPRSHTP